MLTGESTVMEQQVIPHIPESHYLYSVHIIIYVINSSIQKDVIRRMYLNGKIKIHLLIKTALVFTLGCRTAIIPSNVYGHSEEIFDKRKILQIHSLP